MCFDDSVDMHRSRRCWLQASRCFFFQFSDERAQLTMDNKSAFTSCGYSLGPDGSIRAAQTWRGFCLRPWGPWVFVPMALAEANRSPCSHPAKRPNIWTAPGLFQRLPSNLHAPNHCLPRRMAADGKLGQSMTACVVAMHSVLPLGFLSPAETCPRGSVKVPK